MSRYIGCCVERPEPVFPMSNESLAHMFEKVCRKLEAEGLIDRLPPEAQEWWAQHKATIAHIKELSAQMRREKTANS